MVTRPIWQKSIGASLHLANRDLSLPSIALFPLIDFVCFSAPRGALHTPIIAHLVPLQLNTFPYWHFLRF
jgi:hypothetical protein